ncbi:hypothetical protein BR93DRAFT_495101 [Coniochaeta sp. PMI_546]|nr:hypothetical protein BR93DRAFT_495101 [Coniochaeta sp. PMI_546]
MPPLSLIELPTEIFSAICDWVYWGHCSDLVEFALASKSCYSVAKRLLCRTISVDIADPQTFAVAVEDCRDTLSRENAWHFVGCLCITADKMHTYTVTQSQQQYRWRRPTLFRDYRGLQDHEQLQEYICTQFLDEDLDVKIQSNSWDLLLDLVAHLPALADIHYLVPAPVPARLLWSLENKDTFCRLHHHGLGLDGDSDAMTTIHADLLTSPHLQPTIVITPIYNDHSDRCDYSH